MKKLLSLFLLSLWATTGNAQFFNDWRDISSAITPAVNPNADLDLGIFAAYALNTAVGDGSPFPQIVDLSGNGFTLADCNTAVLQAAGFGNVNHVADFHSNSGDAVRGFAVNGLTPAPSLSADVVFTVGCWVKNSNTVVNNPVFDTWGPSPGFYLGQSGGGNWTFGLKDSGNTSRFVDGPALDTGTWHYISGGWDGANIWFKIDSSARTTGVAVAHTHAMADDTEIGRYANGCGSSINTDGFVAQCFWWTNVTLSDSQLNRVYNSGNGLATRSGGYPTGPY